VGRLDDLDFTNQGLALNLLAIPMNVGGLNLNSLKIAWNFIHINQRPHIVTFCAHRNTPTILRDLIVLTQPIAPAPPMAAVTSQNILILIATVVESVMLANPGYAGPFDGIARDALINLSYIRGLHGPGTGFAGFAAWGEGNHTSPASNAKWHFLKHVLFMDDSAGLSAANAEILISVAQGRGATNEESHATLEGMISSDLEDDPATVDECADWWLTLRMRLTKADCDRLIPPHRQQDRDAVGNWCIGGVLSDAYVGAFLESGIHTRNPELLALLMQNYQNDYEQYAIAKSRNMNDVFVSSNGAKVFVAGTDGDNFIIGRVGANGTLGISSCYRPANPAEKMTGAKTTMMWSLV
jgi:hypothetical protein